ncbi:MAG TPA: diguanylate cyclase [Anaerolineales bacterium]|nr:diguanylate cyclase [Anaerolineales bacterium]
MKVLLYNDNDEQIRLLQDNLNKHDFSLIVEQDPQRVFDHLNEDAPELIISNFELPNGGIDLVNAILAMLQAPFPYVLFLTEAYSEKYAVNCLGPVIGDFISKPVQEAEFNARISVAERAIALQKYLRSQEDVPPDLAMYDDLTNLLNRQAVYERALAEMSRSQREAKPLCLALIEVCNADEIEAQYDENTARQAIRFVARAIRANIRMYDVVGRWMGAKFLVVLPGIGNEDAGRVIRRVYDEIQSVRIRMANDEVLNLVVSAGYTWKAPRTNTALYELIDQADKAVHQASTFEKEDKIARFEGLKV